LYRKKYKKRDTAKMFVYRTFLVHSATGYYVNVLLIFIFIWTNRIHCIQKANPSRVRSHQWLVISWGNRAKYWCNLTAVLITSTGVRYFRFTKNIIYMPRYILGYTKLFGKTQNDYCSSDFSKRNMANLRVLYTTCNIGKSSKN